MILGEAKRYLSGVSRRQWDYGLSYETVVAELEEMEEKMSLSLLRVIKICLFLLPLDSLVSEVFVNLRKRTPFCDSSYL